KLVVENRVFRFVVQPGDPVRLLQPIPWYAVRFPVQEAGAQFELFLFELLPVVLERLFARRFLLPAVVVVYRLHLVGPLRVAFSGEQRQGLHGRQSFLFCYHCRHHSSSLVFGLPYSSANLSRAGNREGSGPLCSPEGKPEPCPPSIRSASNAAESSSRETAASQVCFLGLRRTALMLFCKSSTLLNLPASRLDS